MISDGEFVGLGYSFDGDGDDNDDDGEGVGVEMETGARRASSLMWEWRLWCRRWREDPSVGVGGQWKPGLDEDSSHRYSWCSVKISVGK